VVIGPFIYLVVTRTAGRITSRREYVMLVQSINKILLPQKPHRVRVIYKTRPGYESRNRCSSSSFLKVSRVVLCDTRDTSILIVDIYVTTLQHLSLVEFYYNVPASSYYQCLPQSWASWTIQPLNFQNWIRISQLSLVVY